MPNPALVGVIKWMSEPLLLKYGKPQLTQVKRAAALQVSIFFAVYVQIHASPYTGSLAANHDHSRTVYGQIKSGTCPANRCMMSSFERWKVHSATAVLTHAHQSGAQQTNARFFRTGVAFWTWLLIVVQKQLIVGRRQVEKARIRKVDWTAMQKSLFVKKEAND